METRTVNIKNMMKKAMVTQAEIAKMLKVSVPAVHYVVTGKKATPRIRKAISMALGKPVSELWPDDQKKSLSPGSRNESAVGDVGRASDPNRG